jgi:site-specific recombinase XerD
MPKFTPTQYTGIVYYQSEKSKDRTFYAKIKQNGKVKWVKIGKASEGMNAYKASQIRGGTSLDMRHGKAINKYTVLTIQQAVEVFLEYRKPLVSAAIYRDEVNYFNRLLDYFGPSVSIGTVQSQGAEAFIISLRSAKVLPRGRNKAVEDKTLSPQTILHHFNTYSRLFKYLVKHGHYEGVNPFDSDVRKAIPERNNEIVRYFSDEENKRYVKTLFQEYKDNKTQEFIRNLLGMYYASGLRRSEVFNLTEPDIDFERNIVTLRDPKSGKDKYVEVSDIALYFIKGQIAAKKKYKVVCPYIFCTRIGTKRQELQKQFATFKGKAGLSANFRLHDLRHNFATLVASAGNDLYVIQKLLTHSDPKTTQRYAHLVKGKMTQAANKALAGFELPNQDK